MDEMWVHGNDAYDVMHSKTWCMYAQSSADWVFLKGILRRILCTHGFVLNLQNLAFVHMHTFRINLWKVLYMRPYLLVIRSTKRLLIPGVNRWNHSVSWGMKELFQMFIHQTISSLVLHSWFRFQLKLLGLHSFFQADLHKISMTWAV